MKLTGKKVLVMGLGLHGGGLGVVKFLVNRGAAVHVTDLKKRSKLANSLQKLKHLPIKYTLGEHRRKDFLQADMIVRNPAVPKDSPYLTLTREHNIPIEMELSLFLSECPTQKIIGVTGTKGKTTTSWLIFCILSRQFNSVVIAGNMGRSLLDQLNKIKQNSWVVLELSSWQLECLADKETSLPYAVLTNIFADHLNRYPNLKAYKNAKKLIFQFQSQDDHLFLNKEDPHLRPMADEAEGKVHFFSRQQLSSVELKNLTLPGQHNQTNAAAAVTTAKTIGVPQIKINQALKDFTGLPHRLEKVTCKAGVTFYNDTTATNPAAAAVALQTLKKPIIWIAGGADKNLNFSHLAQNIPARVKKVYLLTGTATPKLKKQLQTHQSQLAIIGPGNNFQQVITSAWQEAENGDIVLLSPAAASFGMFKNEFERGEKFRQIVSQLHEKE